MAIIYGSFTNDYLFGTSSNDSIYGYSGNDTLDGSLGADFMDAGDGNDIYYVDNVGDIASEVYNDSIGGVDLVYSSVSHTLGFGIENLTLTGFFNINGTGNSNNNVIKGNSGINTLNGGLGADTMDAGDGSDIYYVDNVGDVVSEVYNDSLGGVDLVFSSATSHTLGFGIENLTLTGSSSINGTGNSNNNVITGNSGNNTINGSGGNDTINGGLGSDTANYQGLAAKLTVLPTGVVTKNGIGTDNLIGIETIIANSSFGNNTINCSTSGAGSSVSISLGSGAVSVLGAGFPLNFTFLNFDDVVGTNGNDTITGDYQNNILNGGLGADVINGGDGSDTYYVDNVGDVVSETFNDSLGGVDSVFSSATSHTLGFGIENLTLTGSSSINGTGNSNNNAITGNSGNNTINGSGGNDTINGGLGSDTANYQGLAAKLTVLPTGVVTKNGIGTDNLIGIETIVANSSFGNNTIDCSTSGAGSSVSISLFSGAVSVLGAGFPLNFTFLDFDDVVGTNGNDTITGDYQNNILNGGLGADVINGGDGSDTYYVDNVGDVVSETYNDSLGGVDSVFSSVSHTLGFGIENLTLTGSSSINGTGNSNNNVITGNSGSNTIYGASGSDVLTGGTGTSVIDTFVYNFASEGADTITDFQSIDRINLRSSSFGYLSLGTLSATRYGEGSSLSSAGLAAYYAGAYYGPALLGVASGTNVQVWYTPDTLSTYYYNTGTLLATLSNQNLANISQSNFSIVV